MCSGRVCPQFVFGIFRNWNSKPIGDLVKIGCFGFYDLFIDIHDLSISMAQNLSISMAQNLKNFVRLFPLFLGLLGQSEVSLLDLASLRKIPPKVPPIMEP